MKPLILNVGCLLAIAFAGIVQAQEPGSVAGLSVDAETRHEQRQRMIDQLQSIIAELDAEATTDFKARLDVVQDRLNQTQVSVSDQLTKSIENQAGEVDTLQMTPSTTSASSVWVTDSGHTLDLTEQSSSAMFSADTFDSVSPQTLPGPEGNTFSFAWSQQPLNGVIATQPSSFQQAGPIVRTPYQTPVIDAPIYQAPMQQFAAPIVQAPAPIINIIQTPPVVIMAPQPIYRVYSVQIPIYADAQPAQRRHHGCRLFNH